MCVTELSTHLLGDAREQSARPDWYTRRRCAGTCGRPSCRGLGRQPSQLDRESNGSEGDSEGALGVVVEFVLSREHESRRCLDAGRGERFFLEHSHQSFLRLAASLWKRARARFA